jgi:hypothetical protein
VLRLAAALALAIGVIGLGGFLRIVGWGPFVSEASRHLRVMKQRTAAPDTVSPLTFPQMAALPRSRPLAEYARLERRGASLEGNVKGMSRSTDGDFHVEVVPTGMTGRSDARHISAEITPQWHQGSSHWRYERLAAAFRVARWDPTPWERAPRRVRLSGWLMYDFEYEGTRPRSGPERLTHWEIHPVTRIEVWDDSLGAFVEIPR